jgi:hypothetical protein
MTAKTDEDRDLAVELQALGYGPLPEAVRDAPDHEEVDRYRGGIGWLVKVLDAPGLIPRADISTWKDGAWQWAEWSDDGSFD